MVQLFAIDIHRDTIIPLVVLADTDVMLTREGANSPSSIKKDTFTFSQDPFPPSSLYNESYHFD